jgi:hypothetical protein
VAFEGDLQCAIRSHFDHSDRLHKLAIMAPHNLPGDEPDK